MADALSNKSIYTKGSSNLTSSQSAFVGHDADVITSIIAEIEYQELPNSRLSSIIAEIEYAEWPKSNISAFVYGCIKSLGSTPAYLNGSSGTETTSNTSAYLKGKLSTSEQIVAYLKGKALTSHNVTAFLKGVQTGSSAISAYLEGAPARYAISSYLKGKDGASDTIYAYIEGKTETVSSLSSFLEGIIKALSSVSVYLKGESQKADNLSAFLLGGIKESGSTSAFLEGLGHPISSQQTLFLKGKDTSQSSLLAFLAGGLKEASFTSVYLNGAVSASEEIRVYLSGKSSQTDTKHAYLGGISVTNTSSLVAYLTGRTAIYNQTGAYLRGQADTTTESAAYLSGGIGETSSLSAYLNGSGILVSSSLSAFMDAGHYSFVPVYINGKSSSIDNQSVYSRGKQTISDSAPAFAFGILRTANNAFLSGNIYTNASVSAFVCRLSEAVSHSKSAYMVGVSRSSSPAYSVGRIVRVDYIWLKTDDLSIAKKFKVLQQDYDDGTLEKSESINKTISGGLDTSIGAIYTTWNMIIRVGAVGHGDYGSLSDLEALYSLNNPNGTPSNALTFIDHRQYEHKVKMIGDMRKNLVGTAVEGETAIYLCRLKLLKIL